MTKKSKKSKKVASLDDLWGAGAEAEVKAVAQNIDDYAKHLDNEKTFAATSRFFAHIANTERTQAVDAVSRPLKKAKKKKKKKEKTK